MRTATGRFGPFAMAIAATALVVSACADTTAPSATIAGGTGGVLPAILDIPPDSTIEGKVFVCKDAGGSTEVFTFSVTIGASAPTNVNVAGGSCLEVHDEAGSASVDVTVVEQAKTGWGLLDIDIERMRTLTSGGLDQYDVTTKTATVRVNNDMARYIRFYNVSDGCTRTIGYWKTHAGFTGNNPDVVTALLPIWLGTSGGTKSVQVTTATQAVSILSMTGGASNGIVKLYAQLLGAKLSIADGADGSSVASTIAAADAFLATKNAADWDSLTKPQKSQVLTWMETLDDFNNGLIGPVHCD